MIGENDRKYNAMMRVEVSTAESSTSACSGCASAPT
jgi:hypothetical protein